MEDKNKTQLFHTNESCFTSGIYNNRDTSLYLMRDSRSQYDQLPHPNLPQKSSNPYRFFDSGPNYTPNIILISPAIFGGLGFFLVASLIGPKEHCSIPGFFNSDHLEINLKPESRGFYKLEFFINAFSIIALLGTSVYIYQAVKHKSDLDRFVSVVLAISILIFFYASEEYFLYFICPQCFDGVAGKSRIGVFLNFFTLSSGAFSVGESYGITPLTTGTKVLLSQESIFNLFIITLLITFVAK